MGLPRHIRVLAACTAALFLSYCASFLFVERPGGSLDPFWDTLVFGSWMLLGVVIVIWRARVSFKVGLGWYLIAGYLGLTLIAEIVFRQLDTSALGESLLLSDLIYLTSYVFVGAGLIILSRRGRSVSPAARIDGLIVGLTASAALLAFYRPLDRASPGSAELAWATLIYPVLDVMFLTIVFAGLAPLRFRPTPAIGAILLAIVAVGIGDFVYTEQVAAGNYVLGTGLELTWALGSAAMIVAALLPNPYRYRPGISRRWTVFTPAAASFVSVGLLAWALISSGPPVVSGLALAALALASVRLVVTMIDLRRAGEGYEQARQDYLTGLVNRRGFTELVDAWFTTVNEDQQPQQPAQHQQPSMTETSGGLVLIGVEGVNEVVEGLGRSAGDELLRAIGKRLRPATQPFPLARLEGTEFAILVTSNANAREVAQAAVAALDAPLAISAMSIRVGVAVGVARPTEGTRNVESLLRGADVALTQARKRGHPIVEFDPADDPAAERNVGLMAELHNGLEHDELVMFFQPLVRVRDQQVIGAEALVRWEHPTRGLLPPVAFIHPAEQAGLIGRVTRTVLAKSCAALRDWLDSGLDLTVSVNISGIDLMDDGLPDAVAAALAAHSLPAGRLILEITETAIGFDQERGLHTVAALRSQGVGIAIDDFGVGYSSLAQLMETPVDEIKLDGRFLRTSDNAKREAAVISARHLAAAIGATMVAEGVEDAADFELLKQLGCELAQGYYFSRPQPADEFARDVRRALSRSK